VDQESRKAGTESRVRVRVIRRPESAASMIPIFFKSAAEVFCPQMTQISADKQTATPENLR
jgi:hypothetical protein